MRLQLIIAYIGTPFAGWQSQRSKQGVQDFLEKALYSIAGRRIIVHGASRTDAGVHALAQSAHIDLGEIHGKMSDPLRWRTALNASLPPEIRVLKTKVVPESFHARFSAQRKIYRYTIWHDEVIPPFYHNRAWHLYGQLDCEILQELAQAITGTHDFRGFTSRLKDPDKNTRRTLYSVKIIRQGKKVMLTLHGNGFLYHMVRMLVGGMVRVAQGKTGKADFLERLHQARLPATPRLAPAGGLSLEKVFYSQHFSKK